MVTLTKKVKLTTNEPQNTAENATELLNLITFNKKEKASPDGSQKKETQSSSRNSKGNPESCDKTPEKKIVTRKKK